MIWRRLLLVVCALLFGGAAVAQTQNLSTIGRAQLWSKVKPKLTAITHNEFAAMFDDNTPGYPPPSDFEYVTSFEYEGTVYTARVGGAQARYAWSYAASQGFEGDSPYQCWVVGKCRAGVIFADKTDTTATNDYIFTVEDTFGRTSGSYYVASSGTEPNKTYYGVINSSDGQVRGVRNIFSTPAFNTTCSGSWQGTGNNHKDFAAANAQMQGRISAMTTGWAQKAPSCVGYLLFLDQTSALVGAWQAAINDASRRNLSTDNFFTVDNITVVDDTPTQEELQDSDGDGIRDADDPNPYGQEDSDGDGTPDRYDPTPNGETPPNQWDVAPGDDETQCQIINIPCNLRKLFIPQVDWGAEWREMRDVMEQKLPFAYISWLSIGANGAQAQDIGIQVCAPIEFDSYQLDWCNTALMQWWRGYGVAMLFASLYISYLVNVVVRIRA